MTRVRTALALALAAALGGCGARDVVATSTGAAIPVTGGTIVDPGPGGTTTTVDPTPGGTTIIDPTPVDTTPVDPAPTGTTSAFCQGSGAPVLLDGTCTGDLSRRAFARAACSCALSTLDELVTDGFDSRVGPWVAGGAGGDVGALWGLSSNALLRIGGNLAVARGDLQAGPTLHVAGELALAGGLTGAVTDATVGGSAWIGGDVRVASLAVTGVLTTAPGAVLSGAISAGSTVSAPVTVPDPCPCSTTEAVDVDAIVAQHRAVNDNAAIGLSAGRLAAVGAADTLALPCGRYFVDRIQGGGLTLRATGRVALFVGGDLTLWGALTVALDPGAELDLFVAGAVNLPASVTLGDPSRPSALRLWFSRGGTINVPFDASWAANLYAPSADFAVTTPVDLFGSIMVSRVNNSAPLRIHHDRAITGAVCVP